MWADRLKAIQRINIHHKHVNETWRADSYQEWVLAFWLDYAEGLQLYVLEAENFFPWDPQSSANFCPATQTRYTGTPPQGLHDTV